jgi:hypothetical protein
MKTVILEAVSMTTIPLNQCNTNLYYGVMSGQYRGFIQREEFESGKYRAMCVHGITRSNCWTEFTTPTLLETIHRLIDRGFTVVTFEKSSKLCEWLSKEPLV